MRFLFFSLLASLLAIGLWPFIKQFGQWAKRKYDAATTFEEDNAVDEHQQISEGDDKHDEN